MPAVSIPSSPVIATPNAPSGAKGAATAGTDADSANAFASVLNGQMNGTPGASSSGSEAGPSSIDKPAGADASTDLAADSLANLLPMLFGTTSGNDGTAIRADAGNPDSDGGDGVAAQAELALALLAAPAGTGQPATERLPVSDRPPVAGPALAGNGAAGSGDAANPAAILAAAGEAKMPRLGTDVVATPGSPKPGSPVAAAQDGVESLRAEGGMRDAAPTAGDLSPDRPMPQQALADVQAATSGRATVEGPYRIAPAVGTRQWESAIGNSLVFMTGQQQNRAEIVLTPPQMGRIEISLTVNASNEATAMFVSANPAVQEALTNAVPRLKEILADAGITLSQADVNAGSPEQSPGGNGDSPRRPATADFGDDGGARAVAAGHWSSAGRGLVDVFA